MSDTENFLPYAFALREQNPLTDNPEWEELRTRNYRSCAALGLPNRRDENWRYSATALNTLARREHKVAKFVESLSDLATTHLDMVSKGESRMVFINGFYSSKYSQLQNHNIQSSVTRKSLGAVLHSATSSDLQSVVSQKPGAADFWDSYNAAHFEDGVYLRVPQQSQERLHIIFVNAPNDFASQWHCRNIIDVGGDLTLTEHHISESDGDIFGSLVSQINLQPGAQLRYVLAQETASKTTLLQRNNFFLSAGAGLTIHSLDIGAALVRQEIHVDLMEQQASCLVRGVCVGKDRQHGDTQIHIAHRAPNTNSEVSWRSMADGRARGIFHGAITVAKGADGSDAKLSNKNLLLSSNAEIDTKPVLEIYADEVKASHGATVGQLDEQALFYLRSRGLSLEQARSLLMDAFCCVPLEDIPLRESRELLLSKLKAHLSKSFAVGI